VQWSCAHHPTITLAHTPTPHGVALSVP
jgi:hypothetical protein